jgi:hypothetical protein
MVRKWSYIKNDTITSSLTKINTLKHYNLINRFSFKIFRFTTRFKNFSIHKTSFIRRRVILWKRRTNYKNLVILSSMWAKPLLSYKNTQNFIQGKSMLPITSSLNIKPNVYKIFQSLHLVKGVNHITFNPLHNFLKNQNHNKTNIQVHSLKQLQNYKYLNLFFPLLIYDNYLYPNKFLLKSKFINNLPKFTNNVISQLITLRKIIIYITLFLLKTKNLQ